MPDLILAQAPSTRKTPLSAPAPVQDRNRALLIKALRTGVKVWYATHTGWHVASRTSPVPHLVLAWQDRDDARREDCDCTWARRERQRTGEPDCCVHYNAGTRLASVVGEPCSHILLVRLHQLYGADGQPTARLAALLAADPELAAAVAVSAYAHGIAWRDAVAA